MLLDSMLHRVRLLQMLSFFRGSRLGQFLPAISRIELGLFSKVMTLGTMMFLIFLPVKSAVAKRIL